MIHDEQTHNPLARLLHFLDQLEQHNLHYDLAHVRDSIMVRTFVPDGMWEIEFFADGTLEVELFERTGGVESADQAWLDQFIADHKD